MAVSSSTDFKSTGTQLLEGALSRMGVLAEEEPLQAYELVRGMRYLTQMLKTWQADGVGTWLYTEGSATLVISDGSYVFGAGGTVVAVPFEITQVRVSDDGGPEYPLTHMSREEYYRMPVRTTSGRPTSFFYDRQRDTGTLYLWPVPDTADFDITFTTRRRIMDVDLGAENVDLPPEWEEAIELGLAQALLGPYSLHGSPTSAEIRADAARTYMIVKAFDVEEGGGFVSILPDYDYFEGYR